jgi:hypothetical protein
MLELHMIFTEKKEADTFNYMVCEFFSGTKPFKENDIIVTPVAEETTTDTTLYTFYVILFTNDDVKKRIDIRGVELGNIPIPSLENVWAFNKIDNYTVGDNNE